MENKKGQEGFIIFLLLCFAAAAVIFGIFALNGNTSKDNSENNDYPNLKILNQNDCLNQKDQFGFKADCALTIKNLENKPVELTPRFECYKLSSPYAKEVLVAEKNAIPSGDQRTFKISYGNSGREWNCEITDFGVTNFN